MYWQGLAVMIIMIAVGLGCFYTGRCSGIEWMLARTWVLMRTLVEYVGEDDGAEGPEEAGA